MPKLFIKNMVCPRCIKAVREELLKLGLTPINVTLGEVEIKEKPDKITLDKLRLALKREGFELLEDAKSKIIELIKTEIIKAIQHYEEFDLEKLVFSKYLSEKLGKDYSYLSSLFSNVEGITIERYVILQKIEKVKELLTYNELTLSEIAYSLGYSSVQHLSRQFKSVTGITASEFQKNNSLQRKGIDSV